MILITRNLCIADSTKQVGSDALNKSSKDNFAGTYYAFETDIDEWLRLPKSKFVE